MASRSGLGPLGKNAIARAAGKATDSSPAHPVVSAAAFASLTAEHGGATMDVNTGHLYAPGEKAYLVGGERNVEGERIPTKFYTPEGTPAPTKENPHQPAMNLSDVMNDRRRIQKATGGRKNAALGSWTEKGEVSIDASANITPQKNAMSVAKQRNEKAIFRMTDMKEFKNYSYDPSKEQK